MPRKGKDYALFFAVDDYRSTTSFMNLKNPVRDAEALAKELREMYDFETKVYPNPTSGDIERVLGEWQNRNFDPDDQLFVFFSGHGSFREFNSKGYFIAKGSRSRFDQAYIDLTDIGNAVAKIRCEHILLAIDACYSGTIDQEIALKGGTGRTFIRKGDGANAERQRIIREQLRNPSRLLLTSGGKEQTYDGDYHSPFANAMLRKLRGAYTIGDGLVLFRDLLSGLDRVTPRPHQGELPGHKQGGFVFVANSMGTGVNVPTLTEPVERSNTTRLDLPDMVFIEGGTFKMGDQFGDGDDDEQPVHGVKVSDFYISNHEVTFYEYDQYCADTNADRPSDQSWGRGNRPVINVSWYDAVNYCNWKSEQSGLQKVYTINGTNVSANWSANGYRLPTEAEWEYAARSGGKQVRFGNGKDIADANEMNFYARSDYKEDYSRVGEYKRKTMPYGSYQASPIGLYDMSGNVLEWCWDWYGSDYYASSKNARDPKGPSTGSNRVGRGGSWGNNPGRCRAAYRDGWNPDSRGSNVGFRLALSVE